jgi:acyl carrier protein
MDSRQELTAFVVEAVEQLVRDKGGKVPAIGEDSSLVDGSIGIDSLDLAVVVVRLQEKTGKDPFSQGFVGFSTVRQLVDLYAR